MFPVKRRSRIRRNPSRNVNVQCGPRQSSRPLMAGISGSWAHGSGRHAPGSGIKEDKNNVGDPADERVTAPRSDAGDSGGTGRAILGAYIHRRRVRDSLY
jgi:hypothetical protein